MNSYSLHLLECIQEQLGKQHHTLEEEKRFNCSMDSPGKGAGLLSQTELGEQKEALHFKWHMWPNSTSAHIMRSIKMSFLYYITCGLPSAKLWTAMALQVIAKGVEASLF